MPARAPFSVGDTHEGLNLAGVLQVPAVFVLQSNRYSYSTPAELQMVNTNLAERVAGGWSIPAERVDGTDALAAFSAIRAAVERARSGLGPQAVEAVTLRMHGHAAHDDARYVPEELREEYSERWDPVSRLEERLLLDGVAPEELTRVRDRPLPTSPPACRGRGLAAPDPADLEDGVWAAPLH